MLGYGQSRFVISADQSQVQFSLGDSLHEVKGVFQIEKREIRFDPKTGEMSGTVIVGAATGHSDSKARDKIMINDELKARTFPVVSFAPHRFTGTMKDSGDSSIAVLGTFTLIGQPHEITVPMVVHVEEGQCTAKGSFTIPHVSWGMKDPSIFMLKVAKDVKINLVLSEVLSD
jgi:hypothetical protein